MEANIYIIETTNKAGTTLVKLGYSSNIEQRLKSYRDANPLTTVIGTFYVKDALAFEQTFHKSHKSLCGREWYSKDTLEEMKEAILKANGVEVNTTACRLELSLRRLTSLMFEDDTDALDEYETEVLFNPSYFWKAFGVLSSGGDYRLVLVLANGVRYTAKIQFIEWERSYLRELGGMIDRASFKLDGKEIRVEEIVLPGFADSHILTV